MSEVLEKVVSQVVGRLNAAATQREKDNLSLETVDVVCGNLNGHLTQALDAASTKESIEEKYKSLESSIKVIRQAVAQEPQKLRSQQRELDLRCSIYNEVLELVKTSQPPPPPVEDVVSDPVVTPASVVQEQPAPQETTLAGLGSLVRD